jgi:hydrogenase-4 component B
MTVVLIVMSIAILGLSGVPGLFGRRRGTSSQAVSTVLMLAGGALGLFEAIQCLINGASAGMETAWLLPWGRFSIRIDALGAVFLIPVFLIPALGSIYGQGYWKQSDHPAGGRKLRFFYGVLAASMAMVVISRDSVLFLIAWEIMAVSAYFLVTADDEDAAACKAGWIYLVSAHVGTVCLIAMFALLRRASGSFAMESIQAGAIPPPEATAVFILALLGFGLKAGLMPLHVWLPGAHANAPSHVSAVMSGVMLKMGIYGIVRTVSLLPLPPAWWGGLLLTLGAASGVLGISFAIGQRDLKRALAYSSIENIGIITIGLGLALVGRTLGRWDWVALGLGGSLLHVWNHGLFKSLLFLNAGSIIHAVHTREIDRLGGLAVKMPRTALLFMVGAAAICALPPLNGLVSEWLIYVGLFRTTGIGSVDPGKAWPFAALAVPAMALIGALALACFVNLMGTLFLGQPRSDSGDKAHDPPAVMTLPMLLLALGCVAVGLLPGVFAPALDRAILAWMPDRTPGMEPLAGLVPFAWISRAAIGLLALAGLAAVALRWFQSRRPLEASGTWDCGYARPSPRMQYTGSSFGQVLVGLFGWALWPRSHRPPVAGPFPHSASFKSHVPDTVLDRLLMPVFNRAGRHLPWFRIFQRGQIQIYLVYFIVILAVLFLWGSSGR